MGVCCTFGEPRTATRSVTRSAVVYDDHLSAWPDEYVVEGDGAQAAVADEVGELTEYVGDRHMVEVADDDVLGPEIVVGHLEEVVLGDDCGVGQRAGPHGGDGVAEIRGDRFDRRIVFSV